MSQSSSNLKPKNDNTFTVLKWPPQLPDLNPIMHLHSGVDQICCVMFLCPNGLTNKRFKPLSSQSTSHYLESVEANFKWKWWFSLCTCKWLGWEACGYIHHQLGENRWYWIPTASCWCSPSWCFQYYCRRGTLRKTSSRPAVGSCPTWKQWSWPVETDKHQGTKLMQKKQKTGCKS